MSSIKDRMYDRIRQRGSGDSDVKRDSRDPDQESTRNKRSPKGTDSTIPSGHARIEGDDSSVGRDSSGSRQKARRPFDDSGSFKERKKVVEIGDGLKKVPSLVKAALFTDGEVAAKESKLAQSLSTYFDIFDQYLWEVSGDIRKKAIWSDADNDELACIARSLLKLGQTNKTVAFSVRTMIDGNDHITAMMFFGVRVKPTFNALRKK